MNSNPYQARGSTGSVDDSRTPKLVLSFLVFFMIYFATGEDLWKLADHQFWPGQIKSVLVSHGVRTSESTSPIDKPPGHSVDDLDSRLFYLGHGLAVDPLRFCAEIAALMAVSYLWVKISGTGSVIGWLTCLRLLTSTVLWLLIRLWTQSSPLTSLEFVVGWAVLLFGVLNLIWSGHTSRSWFDRMTHGLWLAGTLNFAVWLDATVSQSSAVGLQFQQHFWLSFAFGVAVTTLASRRWRFNSLTSSRRRESGQ